MRDLLKLRVSTRDGRYVYNKLKIMFDCLILEKVYQRGRGEFYEQNIEDP